MSQHDVRDSLSFISLKEEERKHVDTETARASFLEAQFIYLLTQRKCATEEKYCRTMRFHFDR